MPPPSEAAGPPVVLLLGPHRAAISGVSTHLNLLLDSSLAHCFRLIHFQVGSEGRAEGFAARLWRLLSSPFALAATLIAERVDIVHINTSLNRRAYWRDLTYLLVGRMLGTRVLYQVHGGNLQDFTTRSGILAPLLHASLRLPEVIIVLSRCELNAYHRFVPGQPVRLLPNGIDPVPYANLEQPPAGRPVELQLLYIGRLSRDKGLHEALHGLHLVRQQGISAHLTIAGGGPDEAELRHAVRELRLGDDVSFVGPVFGDAKISLLASIDALLLPSYSEGLPYALLECMAAGIPAITTPVGAIPDVVTEGLHGLFVPPRNIPAIARAISQLATEPGRLAKMGMACRNRVASAYSISHLVNEFTQVYSEFGTPLNNGAATR